jgi:hypothetical protein
MPHGDEDSGWGEPMLVPGELARAALAGALILERDRLTLKRIRHA